MMAPEHYRGPDFFPLFRHEETIQIHFILALAISIYLLFIIVPSSVL